MGPWSGGGSSQSGLGCAHGEGLYVQQRCNVAKNQTFDLTVLECPLRRLLPRLVSGRARAERKGQQPQPFARVDASSTLIACLFVAEFNSLVANAVDLWCALRVFFDAFCKMVCT